MERTRNSHFVCLATLLVLAVGVNSIASAQTRVNGRVIDSATGVALRGANVHVQNTQIGTATEMDGSFELSVDRDPPFVLLFTFVGYRREARVINTSEAQLDVGMVVEPIGSAGVVVGATLREEEVRDVPVSVTVLGQEMLSGSLKMDRVGDAVKYSAGVSGQVLGTRRAPITIRGIGTSSFTAGSENSVATFLDGVYVGRYTMTPPLYDVERIEILKGPQGTLQGRNAAAGAIMVVSRRPQSTRQLNASVGIGSFGKREANYGANLPLRPNLAVRVAGRVDFRDGTRIVTNQGNSQAGNTAMTGHRVSLLHRPNNRSNWLLSAAYSYEDEGPPPYYNLNTDLGVTGDPFEREIELNDRGYEWVKNFGIRLEGNRVLTDRLALKSISSYRRHDSDGFYDLDASPELISAFQGVVFGTFISQDIRLQGTSDRTNWLVAANYFYERNGADVAFTYNDNAFVGGREIAADGLGFEHPAFTVCDATSDALFGACREDAVDTGGAVAVTNAVALYGDVTHSVSPRLKVSAGARLSIDRKDYETYIIPVAGVTRHILGRSLMGAPTLDGPLENDDGWTGFQPRLALVYRLSADAMTYASFSRGYKAGGFNNWNPTRIDEETSNAFEVGLKTSFFDDRVRLNITGYYTDYRDLQVLTVQGVRRELSNASDVESRGIEVEASIDLFDGLMLASTAFLGKSRYVDYVDGSSDFSGNVPDRSPDHTYSILAVYEKSLQFGSVVARVDYSYQSLVYYDRFNTEAHSQPGYGLLDAQIGLEELADGRLSVAMFGSNLLDEEYLMWAVNLSGRGTSTWPGLPRIVGLKVGLDL